MQRRKGKRVELEAAHALDAIGLPARRSVQYCGRAGNADVTLDGGVPIHVEVKARASHACIRFIEQAQADAKPGDIPVVLIREDGTPRFFALVSLDELPRLAEEIVSARGARA